MLNVLHFLHWNGTAAHCWSLQLQPEESDTRKRKVCLLRASKSLQCTVQHLTRSQDNTFGTCWWRQRLLSAHRCVLTQQEAATYSDFCNSTNISVKDESGQPRDGGFLAFLQHTQLEKETESLAANSADSPGKHPAAFWSGSLWPQTNFP